MKQTKLLVPFYFYFNDKRDDYIETTIIIIIRASFSSLFYVTFSRPLKLLALCDCTVCTAVKPVLIERQRCVSFCFRESAIDFMSFRFWIGIWVFIYLILIVALDLSAFVCYITRFTEESFAVLISVIFIYEACSKILEIWTTHPIRRNRINTGADYACYCSSPSLIDNSSANLLNISSTTNHSGVDEFLHEAADNGSFVRAANNSTLYDFANWSATLPEDCLTFRHRVVIQYGCASASDCTERGWTLSGLACQDDGVVQSIPDVFLLSCMLFFGTFSAAMFFRTFRNTRYFPTQVSLIEKLFYCRPLFNFFWYTIYLGHVFRCLFRSLGLTFLRA